MSIRPEAHIKGSVHDVVRLAALSGDDCHVLFVSSRTLYLMANFAMGEVDYLGRYAKEIYDGGLIDVVDSGDTEETLVREIANNFGLEVIPVCDDLTAAIEQTNIQLGLINASIQAAGVLDGCCVPVGSPPVDDAPPLGDPDVDDPPEGFIDWPTYNTYKCRAANKIADDWIATLSNMATLGGVVATIGALALGAFFSTSLLSGILVGLMILGFSAFTAAAIIIGALILMVLSGAGLLAYFADLGQDISDTKEDLVCQLFEAQSPSEAATIVIDFTLAVAALITYDPGDDDALFQAQLSAIVTALFNSAVTNLLFELDEEINVYVGTIDCDDCPGPSALGCYWDTSDTTPFGVIVWGARETPPEWDGGADFSAGASGWCTTTVRTVGTYQTINYYFKNPVYGHPEWGNGANDTYWSTTRIFFTIQNTAVGAPVYGDLGLGGYNTPVRGPSYSSGAYRSNTSGSPELVTWDQVNLGLDPLREWCRVSFEIFYDTNYDDPNPGCIRQLHLCSQVTPGPWE